MKQQSKDLGRVKIDITDLIYSFLNLFYLYLLYFIYFTYFTYTNEWLWR